MGQAVYVNWHFCYLLFFDWYLSKCHTEIEQVKYHTWRCSSLPYCTHPCSLEAIVSLLLKFVPDTLAKFFIPGEISYLSVYGWLTVTPKNINQWNITQGNISRCLVLTKNCHNSSSWHCNDSGVCGSSAATAVVMKTLVETAMAGEKTTNNNQLKVVVAMATGTAMMKATATTMKMKGDGGGGGGRRWWQGKDNNQQLN